MAEESGGVYDFPPNEHDAFVDTKMALVLSEIPLPSEDLPLPLLKKAPKVKSRLPVSLPLPRCKSATINKLRNKSKKFNRGTQINNSSVIEYELRKRSSNSLEEIKNNNQITNLSIILNCADNNSLNIKVTNNLNAVDKTKYPFNVNKNISSRKDGNNSASIIMNEYSIDSESSSRSLEPVSNESSPERHSDESEENYLTTDLTSADKHDNNVTKNYNGPTMKHSLPLSPTSKREKYIPITAQTTETKDIEIQANIQSKDVEIQTDKILIVSKDVQEVLEALEKNSVIERLKKKTDAIAFRANMKNNNNDVTEISDSDSESNSTDGMVIDDRLMNYVLECSNKNKELVAGFYSAALSEAYNTYNNDGWSNVWKVMVNAVRLSRNNNTSDKNTPKDQTVNTNKKDATRQASLKMQIEQVASVQTNRTETESHQRVLIDPSHPRPMSVTILTTPPPPPNLPPNKDPTQAQLINKSSMSVPLQVNSPLPPQPLPLPPLPPPLPPSLPSSQTTTISKAEHLMQLRSKILKSETLLQHHHQLQQQSQLQKHRQLQQQCQLQQQPHLQQQHQLQQHVLNPQTSATTAHAHYKKYIEHTEQYPAHVYGYNPYSRQGYPYKSAEHYQKRVESMQTARQQLQKHWTRHQMGAMCCPYDVSLKEHLMHAPPPSAQPKQNTMACKQLELYEHHKKVELLQQKSQHDASSIENLVNFPNSKWNRSIRQIHTV